MHFTKGATGTAIEFCMIFTMICLFFPICASSANEKPKRTLKNNMMEQYHILPEKAENFSKVFKNGMIYGRLRTNYFYFEFENGKLHDPTGFGVGGSLIYKTARFHGISATAGFYTSQNFGLLNREDALCGRSGKDTFSRYDRLEDGDWGMEVLAEAYLQYNLRNTEIKIGRQRFESFLTASNDTKMIPNTFEGGTLVSRDICDTTVTLGFLTAEKNRDHTTFHDVITFDDGKGDTYSKWNNQDDSVSHWGLSYANLKAAGENVDNELLVAGVTNTSVDRLKLDLGYIGVPDLFYSVMAESNYRIPLPGDFSLTPGFRYMQQFDKGAGDIGGAALDGGLAGKSGAVEGYDDADSVDARLYTVRLVLDKGAGKLLTGYSKVSDKGDFIAPWRGFPTGGYTRPMGHYNWFANTESWMIQAYYDFGKAGILEGFRATIDFVYTDYDDKKERLGGHVLTDQRYVHADMWYVFTSLPELEAKIRMAYANADDLTNPGSIAKVGSRNASYREIRFEMNYLF